MQTRGIGGIGALAAYQLARPSVARQQAQSQTAVAQSIAETQKQIADLTTYTQAAQLTRVASQAAGIDLRV